MSWVAWVIVGYFLVNFGVVLTMASEKTPREPYTASDVLWIAILSAVVIWAVTHPDVLR